MLYLMRKEYPDRVMDEDDLDGVAVLWRGWYEQIRGRAPQGREVYQYLEIRLWGFARERSDELLRRLKENLAAYGLSDSSAGLADPDTIKIVSPRVPLTELLPRGLWLDLFGDPEFSGLPIMVRLAISEYRHEAEGPGDYSITLVLVGELQKDRLQLKALWPNLAERDQVKQLFHRAVWPEEKNFLRALDGYLATGKVVFGPVAASLSASRGQAHLAHWIMRLLFDLPGQAKLTAFLGRVAFFTCLMGMPALLLLIAPRGQARLLHAEWLPLIGLAGFGFNVWWKLRHIFRYHARMKTALRKIYTRPVHFPAIDLDLLGVTDNPALVKYSRELEAAGAQHLIDVRIDPPTSALSYIRIFQLPSDRTYSLLNVMLQTGNFQYFPAHAFLLANTWFEDGSRLISTNAKGAGYQKKRKANVVLRCFPEAHNPGEFIERHRQVLKGLLEEGCRLAPLMSAQGVIEAQIKEHEESSVLAKEQGYFTWSAAIRQSFGMVRREYLQDS